MGRRGIPELSRGAVPEQVLVAPDSFKGTFSSAQVARAIARGLQDGGWPVDTCPTADGGEGTLEVLLGASEAEPVRACVTDPLGRSIEANFGLRLGGRRTPFAIVESASAAGLGRLEPAERDPVAASTAGVGELILAAVAAGAEVVNVGVGGTATTDGGAGALGAIRAGGGIDGARIVALCDVRTSFERAAEVFAPQKGATPRQVSRLTRRLHAQASRFPRDPRGVPMTGAGGGLAGGLWAELGAELLPGAQYVLRAARFPQRCSVARAVITGEGRLDAQSLAGKIVFEVSSQARQTGVPCHAVVGGCDLDDFETRVLDLQAVLEAQTLAEITAAARRLAGMI